jgi:hypothetical protein
MHEEEVYTHDLAIERSSGQGTTCESVMSLNLEPGVRFPAVASIRSLQSFIWDLTATLLMFAVIFKLPHTSFYLEKCEYT